ncbi:uncharacterized protein [Aegilops tauschii subsp. strangulata]|uniref:uncharacterized protein n=1 Tax=Aegilops tauschii subsp. strangulata TaxID=200361 RepID=UPI003CC83A8F
MIQILSASLFILLPGTKPWRPRTPLARLVGALPAAAPGVALVSPRPPAASPPGSRACPAPKERSSSIPRSSGRCPSASSPRSSPLPASPPASPPSPTASSPSPWSPRVPPPPSTIAGDLDEPGHPGQPSATCRPTASPARFPCFNRARARPASSASRSFAAADSLPLPSASPATSRATAAPTRRASAPSPAKSGAPWPDPPSRARRWPPRLLSPRLPCVLCIAPPPVFPASDRTPSCSRTAPSPASTALTAPFRRLRGPATSPAQPGFGPAPPSQPACCLQDPALPARPPPSTGPQPMEL